MHGVSSFRNVRINSSSHAGTEGMWGSRGIGTHCLSQLKMQVVTLALGMEPQYQLNRRLSGPQSCSGHFGEDKFQCTSWKLNDNCRSYHP